MRRILAAHAARYPAWGLDDLYKLLYQAALGSEHAVRDEVRARDWFTWELAGLSAGPEEPLVDPISPGGEVVRVHLRPFVRYRFDEELLLDAFLRTERGFPGRADFITQYGVTEADIAREGILCFGAEGITACIASKKEAGFPPIHHLPALEAAYRPAYRVVARRELPPQIIAVAQ
jgi:hypothetical protein